MKIELKSLDLVHFKCFPKLHLDFHEGVNSLFGANAAGKTSVYDALTWLLFDKDSAGHSRPAIKPTGAPAGTMPEVTAILEVDGEPIKLRKVLREKWEKPRGSSIERYAGDTRDYYIDDVPLAENAYKRRIAELIDERQFKLLTDVWAVTKGMHWKDRRTLLAEICGLPEDKQLLATAPQFAELTEKVGRRTVDEYKSVLMKQRKDMNANLNTLPVRVDECSRMVTELESLDFAAAHSESDRLQAERERVQGELVKLANNPLPHRHATSWAHCKISSVSWKPKTTPILPASACRSRTRPTSCAVRFPNASRTLIACREPLTMKSDTSRTAKPA